MHLIRFTSLRVCTATYISIDAVSFTLVAVHNNLFRSQDSTCFGHKSMQMLKRYTHLQVEAWLLALMKHLSAATRQREVNIFAEHS